MNHHNLIPLREYCKQNNWPRLPQWHHWIYSRNEVARNCIKKIGKRYLVDLKAWETYIQNASLDNSSETNTTSKTLGIPYSFYFVWDSQDFQYWKKMGLIPPELLAGSRVRELLKYIYTNRDNLFKELTKRRHYYY